MYAEFVLFYTQNAVFVLPDNHYNQTSDEIYNCYIFPLWTLLNYPWKHSIHSVTHLIDQVMKDIREMIQIVL